MGMPSIALTMCIPTTPGRNIVSTSTWAMGPVHLDQAVSTNTVRHVETCVNDPCPQLVGTFYMYVIQNIQMAQKLKTFQGSTLMPRERPSQYRPARECIMHITVH